MTLLSIAILARDEERHIGGTLESARSVADETVVLLDPRTADGTAAICRRFGARIVEEPFVSFSAQRNRALAACAGAWVLFLDADERLTPELRAELERFKADPPADRAGFWIPRRNTYWGRALRGGGWYPDHQLRLLRRGAARYDERRLVHELAELDGPDGRLAGHLTHINIESWGELRAKQRAYALAEAATLHAGGARFKPRNLALQPMREVWRRFVTWRGYRDGALGLLLALVMGWYELVKYARLRQLSGAPAPSSRGTP
ncbi:MAG TPA: glycosyltransferase family 2 protein [Herpetosiphonaceae bacterium]